MLVTALCLATSAQAQLRYAGSDTVEPVIEAAQIAYARGHAGYKLQI
jgi:ABC-type phosphate transport system substrate-binding protein